VKEFLKLIKIQKTCEIPPPQEYEPLKNSVKFTQEPISQISPIIEKKEEKDNIEKENEKGIEEKKHYKDILQQQSTKPIPATPPQTNTTIEETL